MSYYDTIEEDLARAKAILERGKTNNGGDIYVAYNLLESFVAEIERLRAERPNFNTLASAMRKVLPPPLLADVIAHLDPLTPFVAFLQAHHDP